MRAVTIALVVSLACGGSPVGSDDSGYIGRGVAGTGMEDAGLWGIAVPCDWVHADCPYTTDGGFCGISKTWPTPVCVLAPNAQTGCPDGSASGATVSVGSCLKFCSGAQDCPVHTGCYGGFCVPF